MSTKSSCTLIPVFGAVRCAGHLLRTARGFRAFCADDREIGLFHELDRAVEALLKQQIEGETN